MRLIRAVLFIFVVITTVHSETAFTQSTSGETQPKTLRSRALSLVRRVRPAAPPPTSDEVTTKIEKAESLKDVITAIGAFNKMGATVSERLAIYEQIPSDLLDVRGNIERASQELMFQSDLPVVIELVYLSALDAKLNSSPLTSWMKYKQQRILRKRFLLTLDAWYASMENPTALTSLEPGKAAPIEAASSQERLISLSTALTAGMDESQLKRLSARQMTWYMATQKNLKAEGREQMASVKGYRSAEILHQMNTRYNNIGFIGLIGGMLSVPMNLEAVGALLHNGNPAFFLAAAAVDFAIVAAVSARVGVSSEVRKKYLPQIEQTTALNQQKQEALDRFFEELPGGRRKRNSRSAVLVQHLRCLGKVEPIVYSSI